MARRERSYGSNNDNNTNTIIDSRNSFVTVIALEMPLPAGRDLSHRRLGWCSQPFYRTGLNT